MKKVKNKAIYLIALCWLVYTCSYIGKLSYTANIHQMGIRYGVDYSQTGMVSTFFFFTYGAGQVINGLFCKKYNIKYFVFCSLLIGAITNFLIINVPDFSMMKYLWLVNGFAMSFLWVLIIRCLAENLNKEELSKATVIMGTTVATGTFIVYGLSALFVAFLSFEWTFYVASMILIVVAFIWLFGYNAVTQPSTCENAPESIKQGEKQTYIDKGAPLLPLFFVLAFFAISDNFIKDGLTSWTPDILSSLYHTPGWLSILLTLLLPILAINGTIVATKIQKTTKDFVATCTFLFTVSTLLIGLVILFLSTSNLVVTLVCFGMVSCLMAGVNNVITSMVPLYMKERVNSGKVAGILNGFCYLGSTISSYGLGLIATSWGWISVFYVIIAVSLVMAIVGLFYTIFKNKTKEKFI